MSGMTPKGAAWRAVDDIIEDLNDRRGLHICDLPPEIRKEIRDKWRRIVLRAIETTQAPRPGPSKEIK